MQIFLAAISALVFAIPSRAATPTISNISPTTANTGSFSLTINGSNFTTSSVQIVVTGPNCPTTTSCVVPNNVLTAKTSTQVVGPVTLNNPGSFTIQVQNGSGTTLSNGATLTVNAPAPTVSSVSPTTMTADNSLHRLTIYGGNFQSANVVQFQYTGSGGWVNGLYNPPSIQNTGQMTISMNPGSTTDTIYVRVCRSSSQTSSSECSSGTQSVSVTAPVSTPTVSYISPTTANTGSFSLTVNGSNFNTLTAQIVVTGPNCPTTTSCVVPNNVLTSKSGTQIVGPVTLNNAGTFTVQVQNGSSGTLSNGASLTVSAPAPTVSSVSPTTMTADNSQHTLAIYGGNFQSGNIVQFQYTGSGGWVNGLYNPPSIQSASQMTIGMNPGSTTDTIYVRVCRSSSQTSSSDCSSGTQSVAVTAPVSTPTISSISPTTANTGTFSLTVNGSNFNTSTAQIVVTGPNCPTTTSWVVPNNVLTSKNGTQIVGPVTLNSAGSFTVQVQNGSSGTLSNGATLTVSVPTPTVSSISPTSMTADNSQHTLTIYGGNFQSSNIVQFQYTGSGGWVNGLYNPPSIQSASQMTISMNPGTVTDTIYVRVCRSSSQTSNADCSSGTQSVAVTANPSTPTISNISPSTANMGSFSLIVNGSNFDTSTAQIVITGPNCPTTTMRCAE